MKFTDNKKLPARNKIKFTDTKKLKSHVCKRLNENIKQRLWIQTAAEDGTLLKDKKNLHCTNLLTYCTNYL